MVRRWLLTLKRLASLPQLPEKLTAESLAHADYDAAPNTLLAFRSAPDIVGQRLLDLGCGLGGKSVYYAERGARMVVGLEVSEERSRVAVSFALQHAAAGAAQFVVGNATCPPFPSNIFDCVISTDVWEHLRSPHLSLRECLRVTRAGGLILISALPYYSPWGAHAWQWLPLPWIQVILPRRCMFSLVFWIEQHRRLNLAWPAAVRRDWSRPDDVGHAQRLTIRSLRRDLSVIGLTPQRFTIIPIGSRLGGSIAKLGQALIRAPLLRELLAGIVIIEICKAEISN